MIDLDADAFTPSVPTSASSVPLPSQPSVEENNVVPSQESQLEESQQQHHAPELQPVASGCQRECSAE